MSNTDSEQTPTGSSPPTNKGETTARARGAYSHSYRNGSLDDKRKAVIGDIGVEVPEVDVEFFLKNLLPSLPPIDLGAIINSLKRGRTITANKWKWFARTEPKASTEHETKTFSPLTKIFDEVSRLAVAQVPSLQQTLVLLLEPDEASGSERMSTTWPDGYFILKEAVENSDAEAPHLWYDLAGTAEVKKRDGERDRDDNVIKQVFSMQHTMRLDPCRRFTFGITIENTNMRLWFASRTVVTVSTPFNFNTDHETLVHIFLALAFGSKAELGWDPTISARTIDGKRVYIFDIGGKKYETIDILSDYAADSLVGRATRVYTVKDMRTETEHVLKDVWVNEGYPFEHETHGRVVKCVGDQLGKEAQEETKKSLLTPRDHCFVSINGQLDHSTDLIMRGHELSFNSMFKLTHKDTTISTRAPSLNVRLKVHRRSHYRVVFEEIAEPIWKIRKLSDVFLVLRDVCRALRYMHKCGYVHRDISPGNLYLYKGRGVLGDLEYAKLLDEEGSHYMRAGTLDTMAIEVATGRHWFKGAGGFPKPSRDYSRALNLPKKIAFTYNVLHDMESIWWVGIWMLFFNRDASIPKEQALKTQEEINANEDKDYARKAREYWTECLFPRTLLVERRYLFFNGQDYIGATNHLSSTFKDIILYLGYMRRILHFSYILYEKTFAESDFDDLHDEFIQAIGVCIEDSGTIELVPYKTTYKRVSKDETVAIPVNAKKPPKKKKAVISPPSPHPMILRRSVRPIQ